MSDERKPLWPWIVPLMVALPVMYVLSIGPVFSITRNEVLLGEEDTVDRFYKPVFWVCSSHRADACLWWYISLWPGPYQRMFTE